jgi:hypothetical protein
MGNPTHLHIHDVICDVLALIVKEKSVFMRFENNCMFFFHIIYIEIMN